MPTSQNRPVVLVPISYWEDVFEGISAEDLALQRKSLEAEFKAGSGVDIELLDSDLLISGLGADTSAFLMVFSEMLDFVKDAKDLVEVGAMIFAAASFVRSKLSRSKLDPVDALKMNLILDAGAVRAVAARYAYEADVERASRISQWGVHPVFTLFEEGFPHAQQMYLVSGRGETEAFFGIFDSHGSPHKMYWVGLYETENIDI